MMQPKDESSVSMWTVSWCELSEKGCLHVGRQSAGPSAASSMQGAAHVSGAQVEAAVHIALPFLAFWPSSKPLSSFLPRTDRLDVVQGSS